MLRGALANAKLQLAILSGENDELRHELNGHRRKNASSMAASSPASLLATLFSVMTFNFWSSGTPSSPAATLQQCSTPTILDGSHQGNGSGAAMEPAPEPEIAEAADRSEAIRALSAHKTFAGFSSEQIAAVVRAIVDVPCRAGEIVIRQGDAEDTCFYIVASGEYSVLVVAKGDTPVHTYRTVGDSFGELALRYGSPRKATVRCDAGGVLWALERAQYQQIGGIGLPSARA